MKEELQCHHETEHFFQRTNRGTSLTDCESHYGFLERFWGSYKKVGRRGSRAISMAWERVFLSKAHRGYPISANRYLRLQISRLTFIRIYCDFFPFKNWWYSIYFQGGAGLFTPRGNSRGKRFVRVEFVWEFIRLPKVGTSNFPRQNSLKTSCKIALFY